MSKFIFVTGGVGRSLRELTEFVRSQARLQTRGYKEFINV